MNLSELLNLGCLCTTLEPQWLQEQLAEGGIDAASLAASHPHLFSATPVFLSARDHASIASAVAALHAVADLPAYQAAALEGQPALAHAAFGPRGVFMGYDFHMTAAGPRLIEINTNAGGAFLHAAAARAHRACCSPAQALFGGGADPRALDERFVEMFRAEWRAQRGETATLTSVAIVDDAPRAQYLAPEFELARSLFERHGIDARVADPTELEWREGALWHRSTRIDLVYNRLTDFLLAEPGHAALAQAYAAGACVVTPHPRAYALHADKRNLVRLSDDALLRSWGASAGDREILRAVVPATEEVSAANAEALWARRRTLFFKPAQGFGSRAAYRGDKLTRRVWSEILQAPYVAQALIAPSERNVAVGGLPTRLKLDVRAYAYDGSVLMLAARTYAGQTTNFRTEGGGFSPVVVVPDAEVQPCRCAEAARSPAP